MFVLRVHGGTCYLEGLLPYKLSHLSDDHNGRHCFFICANVNRSFNQLTETRNYKNKSLRKFRTTNIFPPMPVGGRCSGGGRALLQPHGHPRLRKYFRDRRLNKEMQQIDFLFWRQKLPIHTKQKMTEQRMQSRWNVLNLSCAHR